jgi:hyperosmotically inducible periplasmic protein
MKPKICALLLIFLILAGVCFGKGAPLTDDGITDQVRIKLANDDVVKGGALLVDVKQGVVTLGGSVETGKQKERAEKLTKKVRGVKQVINNITLRK